MRTEIGITRLIGAFVITAMLGCGGGSSSNESIGTFETGLNKSLQISSLNPQEMDRLCTSLGRQFEQFLAKDICQLLTIIGAATENPPRSEQSCQANVESCIDLDVDSNSCNRDALSVRTCTASVSLFERCVNEYSAAIRDLAGRAQCSTLDPTLLNDFQVTFPSSGSVPQVPACVELEAECPGAIRL